MNCFILYFFIEIIIFFQIILMFMLWYIFVIWLILNIVFGNDFFFSIQITFDFRWEYIIICNRMIIIYFLLPWSSWSYILSKNSYLLSLDLWFRYFLHFGTSPILLSSLLIFINGISFWRISFFLLLLSFDIYDFLFLLHIDVCFFVV